SYAYIGDVVYELLARTSLLYPLKKTADYHDVVVRKVRAEEQSRLMKRIIESDLGLASRQVDAAIPFLPLLPHEHAVLKRGRNCVKSQPSRLSGAREVYQDATSLECLVGYLYLENCEGERFRMLAEWIKGEIVKGEIVKDEEGGGRNS
ncbi:hypothetical protein TrRE_jg8718, partial [Triparma retinervis]